MSVQSHPTVVGDTEVLIPDVSPEHLTHLAAVVRRDGGTVTGETSGLVENTCFGAKFQYDADTRLLTLQPFRLMPGLNPRRLRQTVEHLLTPPSGVMTLESGDTIYTPQPYSCATYNWAIGFFTNNSGLELTYSGSSTQDGNLQASVVNKIPDKAKPSDHTDGFWINKGGKDSVTGCFGSISYQLAGGLTTVTVTYGVNTLSTTSATVALSGQNASRYVATCTLQSSFYGAAAYIYPYIDLEQA